MFEVVSVRVRLCASLFLCFGCASANRHASTTAPAVSSARETSTKISAALASSFRTPGASKRDVYRHPLETLQFFGLKDDMNVVELWPGAGWYTEILLPVLAERGTLTVTQAPSKHPERFTGLHVSAATPPAYVQLGANESADLVVTFRNMHNWVSDKQEIAVLSAAFKVLKHGGVFGLTDHRAKADADPSDSRSGYLSERWVIKTVESVGFRLVGKSELNANPRDTKDYPDGVWTLPPSYRLGAVDHDKYAAIGESDRMTLKFMKP